ncbi:MAG: EAL domain-containing protein [Actinomycetota bacterium]|nr:EAL domain-containing protein [Actinomycetota bacterium]
MNLRMARVGGLLRASPNLSLLDVDTSGVAAVERSAAASNAAVAAVAAAIGLPLAIGCYLAMQAGSVGEIAYLAVLISAATAACIGARSNPLTSMPWLIAIGVTVSAAGDAVWQWLDWTRDIGSDVSVADALWLASYVAIGAALLRSAPKVRTVDADGVIDFLVVFLVALVAQWEFAFDEIVTDATYPLWDRVVWALYPTLDAALLAVVVRAGLTRRFRGGLAALVGAGSGFWLLSDFSYTLFPDSERLEVWMNLGWMLGSVFLACTVWYLRAAPATQTGKVASGIEVTRPAGIAVALVPLLVPGAVMVIEHLRGDLENVYLLFTVSVLLIGLAFTRGNRLLHAENAARAAVRSQERYSRMVALHSADAFLVLDRDGVVLNDAPSLAALVGRLGWSASGEAMLKFVLQPDRADTRAVFERCLASSGQTFETELRVRHQQGHEMWLSARMTNLLDDPDIDGIVVNLHDITGRKRAEAELSHRAFHDGLTELANRALFCNRVDHTLARNRGTGRQAAVIFLDLDGFKTVNDSLGHAAGDKLLKEVANRLVQAVRSADTVARLGGDEFAILLEQSQSPLDESEGLAERVLQSLALPIDLDGQCVTLSASFGIAASDGASTAASLLRDADVAMYRAKTAGKARWVIYDPEMHTAAVERLQLENELLGALESGQFVVEYQPIIRLADDTIKGFEALIRWQHPRLGTIQPDRFIPIAEETGAIIPIGTWVLNEACGALARWQRQFPEYAGLTMAVNLSTRQLGSPDLVAAVRAALAASGIEPSTLVLEMTETALIQDAGVATDRLRELSALGVLLAIDDFGTGYSSLSYLRQFPVDILKIDRSFISTITEATQLPAIVTALVELGRTLQLELVAEGVEVDIQRDELRRVHCGMAQGFLFSHPLGEAAAGQLLDQSVSVAVV